MFVSDTLVQAWGPGVRGAQGMLQSMASVLHQGQKDTTQATVGRDGRLPHLCQAACAQAKVGAGACDVAEGIAAGQHVLPKLLVDVVEDVGLWVDVGEGLGGQHQGAAVIPHGLQHLRVLAGKRSSSSKGVRREQNIAQAWQCMCRMPSFVPDPS